MANVKISDLTASSAASGTQEYEVNESGTSKKVTGSQLLAYIKANTSPADIGAQAADADIPTVSASQAEMEAGTETALRSMSPLRVKQAIAANAPQAFAAGTVMLFRQTSAPTGWTKDTTNYNAHAIRVVTGTVSSGGSVDFTTAFASQTPSGSVSVNVSGLSAGATTLSTSQMPNHNHTINATVSGSYTDPSDGSAKLTGGAESAGSIWRNGGTNYNPPNSISSNGSGSSHSHSISGSATGSFTGNAINLAVKYCDVIFATKN